MEARGPGATSISWEETGTGPGFILIHSLGTDSGMWAPAADTLSGGCRVIRMDLRGHGRSEAPPGAYTIDMLGADVLAVADAANLHRFHLGGISIGGQVALWAAIHHPDRLLSVVLSNTAARIGSREAWEKRVAAVRSGGMESISDQVVGGWFSGGFSHRHPERWEQAKQTFEATDPEGYIGCCWALAEADLREQMTEVSVPTLIVAGEVDRSTPPSDAEWLRDRIAGSRLHVMKDCAHLPNLEKPEEYAYLLADWLG